jgi:hypothetical protein
MASEKQSWEHSGTTFRNSQNGWNTDETLRVAQIY